jgi:hypothetical protein
VLVTIPLLGTLFIKIVLFQFLIAYFKLHTKFLRDWNKCIRNYLIVIYYIYLAKFNESPIVRYDVYMMFILLNLMKTKNI